MKVGLIADIHGNRVALETVIAALDKERPDQIVCLGDVAVMGPDPAGTIDLLRTLGCPVIMGNADDELLKEPMTFVAGVDHPFVRDLIVWSRAQLDDEQLAFVRSFVPTLELDLGWGVRLLCFHGSPRSNTEVIGSTTELDELRAAIGESTATLLAGGHTHHQLLRRFDGQWLINPGSVGLTHRRTRIDLATNTPPWAEFAVITVDRGAIEVALRAVPLDLERMRAAAPDAMPHRDDWLSTWSAPTG